MDIFEVENYLMCFTNREYSTENLTKVMNQILGIKADYVKKNMQNEAKRMWCLEQVLKIQSAYLNAFHLMKQEKFYDAWCTLEICENELSVLSHHFPIDEKYYLNFIIKHVGQYQGLFPYKLFISPGFIELEKKCTVCNRVISIRNPCGHKPGEVYNGELCGRLITKAEMLEISLVESPVQKCLVPFTKDPTTGNTIDHYNYSLIKNLIKRLESPFEWWDMKWTKIRHPHLRYNHISRNDKCPCGSDKKYKDCCLKEDGVLRPHCEIVFSRTKPIELLNIEYSE